MIEINQNKREKAILIAIKTRNVDKETVNEYITELEELADTAGADAVFKIIQDRDYIDNAYFIGRGKAEEIQQLIEMNDIDLVIFDDDLSPVQSRNLEKLFDRKVVDRSGLILDIFALHAQSKEAKTQVELAQLQYLLPRLTRAWTHLSKQYGGIGTKGPGETQIETDRRMIRNRITHLKGKLKKIEAQRSTQTKGRERIFTASLVGYTNAGKSTLFNRLTQSSLLAADKLFATLDSTTRALELEENMPMLVSDTVGFIRKLPPNLIASFKSTLDEVREADLILHVIDMSHRFYEDHIEVVNSTLKDLDCDKKPVIRIFNKVDLLEDRSRIEYLKNKYENSVIVSAARGINLESLQNEIKKYIEKDYEKTTLRLKIERSKLISVIHQLANVLDTKYEEDHVLISYKASKQNSEKIKRMAEQD